MSRSASPVRLLALAGLIAAAPAAPAAAADPGEPAANRTPDAGDVAMTPITDLNLRKDEIPPVLLEAVTDPYASADLRNCADVAGGIAALDAALGPDMDVIDRQNTRFSAGVMAKSVVASFIPFRGILREISGAAEHQRLFEDAVYAGAVRRGFLKGLGQQMKCHYPARPAFARVVVNDPPAARKRQGKKAPEAATTYVAEPVVQTIPARSPRR